jgi:hypothetical protein
VTELNILEFGKTTDVEMIAVQVESDRRHVGSAQVEVVAIRAKGWESI